MPIRGALTCAWSTLNKPAAFWIAWPGITLAAAKGRWDLSAYEGIALDVKNVGGTKVTVCCRVDNPGGDGRRNCVTGRITLGVGDAGTLKVDFVRKPPKGCKLRFFGMRGTPLSMFSDHGIDPANVTQLIVFVPRPKQDHAFQIDNIRAEGHYLPLRELLMSAEEFFPMIDELGQYIHREWPGKTHSVAEMRRGAEREAADLAEHPGPSEWDEYGGWATGPQLEATGFFRPEKYRGKWWLVDPQGRLFWSHGIDCVRPNHATTPITDRKDWFRLPEPGSPFAQFFGWGRWAPRGYYKGRRYETYDFSSANLLRKYGENWREIFADISHRRIRSWGMNTIGNWSSAEIYLQHKTPYVVAIHFGGPSIEGSRGVWRKFHDVFDPRFMRALRKRMAWEKGRSAGDPWCIGYFVDNELGWGRETSLAEAT
ncbi:MAG TPA: beta-agarase, partial [Planctomycetaceae bacterium]|nr:beta-agarase [Planctomycetaceae bacterium]